MDNKELEAQLESLMAKSCPAAENAGHDEAWRPDAEALEQLTRVVLALDQNGILANEEEIRAVLEDYKRQGEQLEKMLLKYENGAGERPIRQGDAYLCPRCRHRIRANHGHCHWCGCAVAWEENGGDQ